MQMRLARDVRENLQCQMCYNMCFLLQTSLLEDSRIWPTVKQFRLKRIQQMLSSFLITKGRYQQLQAKCDSMTDS